MIPGVDDSKTCNENPASAGRSAAPWLVLAVSAALAAMAVRFFARVGIPVGWDSLQHTRAAHDLWLFFRHQPLDTVAFLRTLDVSDPPLTYLAAASFLLVKTNAWAFFAATLLFDATFVFFSTKPAVR